MTLWKILFAQVPTDQQQVWIRRTPANDKPTLATYDLANHQFLWTDQNDVAHALPEWAVHSWRP